MHALKELHAGRGSLLFHLPVECYPSSMSSHRAEPPSSSTLFLQLLISDLPNASIVSAIHDAYADAPSPQATGDILS